jgi:hypothetical protein
MLYIVYIPPYTSRNNVFMEILSLRNFVFKNTEAGPSGRAV